MKTISLVNKIKFKLFLRILTTVFLLLAVILTLYLVKKSQEIRKKAAETTQQIKLPSVKDSEKYKPGEVLVKFKNIHQDIPKDFSETDISSIFPINSKYKVKKIEKVFKEAQSPVKLLSIFKQKFSREIEKGVRKINEEEFLKIDLSKIYKITFDENVPLEKIIDELKKNPEIEYAEPNFIVKIQLIKPNDPYYFKSGSWGQPYSDLWGIKQINTESAWEVTTGSEEVVIADVDTGVDRNHEDLQDNMWVNKAEIPNNNIDDDQNGYIDDYYGWDFFDNDNDPIDDNGHGTHTAGTIAAVGNNGIGIVGVCWRAKIMAVKFLSSEGWGYASHAAKALYYAAIMGAKISSNSWAGSGFSQTISEAVSFEHAVGMTVVVAAGNTNYDALNYFPASLDKAITVAATEFPDKRAYFSNWGEKIDVSAPGVDILSARAANNYICYKENTVGEKYCRLSGTSMATPHVAGLASLLLSKDPTLTNEEIRQLIRINSFDLGVAGKDLDFGFGRIDAGLTLSLIKKPLVPFIISPSTRQKVSATFLNIIGGVLGANFSNYKIEVGEGRKPTEWIKITESDKQIKDGILGTLDLTNFKDGFYIIRLTATDNLGQTYQYQVYDIEVDNFEALISSPLKLISKEGEIEIIGTAVVKGDFIFQDYSLEWKEDSDNTSWSKEGISLINNGLKPVSTSILGKWDTSFLVDGRRYLLRLIVRSTNGNFYEFSTKVYYSPERNLRNGWPQKLESPVIIYGNRIILASDINNDEKKEIITHNWARKIYIFDDQGNFLEGWPFDINPIDQGEFIVSVLTANVSGSKNKEIVVKTSLGRVFVIDKNGNILSGWPKKETISSNLPTINALVAEDLDNDERVDIIVNQNDSLIHVYNFDGSEKQGWPVNIETKYLRYGIYISTNDVDGDGFKEVIANSYDKIYVFRKDGSILKGWPKEGFFERIVPGSADLNLDGKAEIITINQNKIIIWNFDGKIKIEKYITDFYFYWYNPSFGDLNNDGFPEFVLVDRYGKIYAFDYRGKLLPGFPVSSNKSYLEFSSPVIISDIDFDYQKDILLTATSYSSDFSDLTFLYAYSNYGKLKAGYPKIVQIDGSPTISDLDNNGELELLFISADEVHVWDLKQRYLLESLVWPQDLYNEMLIGSLPNRLRLTGCYKPCSKDIHCQTGLVCENLSCQPEKSCTGYSVCLNPTCPNDNTCQCSTPFPPKTY